MILSAGGYSFYRDRKWLNRRVFCVEPEQVVKAMSAAYPQQERLKSRLNEFAGALVGRSLFKSLYSILDLEFEGRRGTFAFALRAGEKADPLVFAYNPSACAFEQVVVPAPRAVFVAGLTCWATDLLAIFDGELGSIALSFGRAQLWNALPGHFRFDVFAELQKVSHPRRRPAEYLRIYERILTSCPTASPTLRHRV